MRASELVMICLKELEIGAVWVAAGDISVRSQCFLRQHVLNVGLSILWDLLGRRGASGHPKGHSLVVRGGLKSVNDKMS